jgi:CMP-N,N'-diacetyllegionaminic acid synthase
MNILFTLCGRAGSKGVKGKNARDFLDIPLAWYSMAGIALYKAQFATPADRIDVVLNTDSEDLIRLVQQVKELPVVILRREERLAGDRVPKVAVIDDCLRRACSALGTSYDVVVDLDITSPLRTVTDIRNAIERKAARPDVDVVYSVTHSRRNPYFNMVKEENGFFCKAIPSNFTTRQQAPAFYDMNASIYAYSPRALMEKDQATFFNSNCDAVVMYDTGILDIDSEDDYCLMQVIAQYLYSHHEDYKTIFTLAKRWKDQSQ